MAGYGWSWFGILGKWSWHSHPQTINPTGFINHGLMAGNSSIFIPTGFIKWGIPGSPVVTAFGAQAMQGQLHQTLHEGRHTEACADLRYRHGVERGGVTCKSIMVYQWFKVYQWFTMVYPMKIMKMEHVPINDNEWTWMNMNHKLVKLDNLGSGKFGASQNTERAWA